METNENCSPVIQHLSVYLEFQAGVRLVEALTESLPLRQSSHLQLGPVDTRRIAAECLTQELVSVEEFNFNVSCIFRLQLIK